MADTWPTESLSQYGIYSPYSPNSIVDNNDVSFFLFGLDFSHSPSSMIANNTIVSVTLGGGPGSGGIDGISGGGNGPGNNSGYWNTYGVYAPYSSNSAFVSNPIDNSSNGIISHSGDSLTIEYNIIDVY